jgi:hypothetical protein
MARLDVITRFSFSSPFRHRSSSAASSASQASTSTAASPTTRSRTVYSPISPETYTHDPSRDSVMSSPAMTINGIVFRQPSIVDLEEERRSFANELGILEPRPIVYWGGVEERMQTA